MKWSRVFLWFALLNYASSIIDLLRRDLPMAGVSGVAFAICMYIRHKELKHEATTNGTGHPAARQEPRS
jgi:hypothetical protein